MSLPLVWLACALLARASGEPGRWWEAGAPTLLKLGLGSALMAGALGMVFFYMALSLGEISRVKPIAFTIAPATAVVLGMLALGEPVTLRKVMAVALILAGVVMLSGR
jgi:uncharacterized membrane protein